MNNYDDILVKLFWNKETNQGSKLYRRFNQKQNSYSNIYNYLNNRFDDSESIYESLLRLVFNIFERPICPICGNKVRFIGKPNNKGIFTKTCCQRCSTKLTNNYNKHIKESQEKAKKTKLEKYGDEHYNNSEQIKKTKLETYGISGYNNLEKIKQTKLERYGDSYFNNRRMDYKSTLKKILIPNKRGIDHKNLNRILNNKNRYSNIFNFLLNIYSDSSTIEETLKRLILNINKKPLCPICGKPVNFIGKQNKMFSKYCSNSCRAKEPKNYNKWIEGQKQYNLENFGVEYNWQRYDCKEKRKQSLIEHYGTDKLYKVPEIRNRIYESVKEKITEIYRKRNITLKEKYNVLSFGELISLPKIQEKRLKTMKKNGTMNSSHTENESFVLLKEKYPDTLTQYRSKLYPFNCDFYIPSLDLYIECNYHWTHGFHIFDENSKEDLVKLNIWKSKNTEYYKNAIITWTKRDLNKINIAKQNNLNYIIFWNMNELKNWLNN